jgi:Cu/Ag efflux protein CusF
MEENIHNPTLMTLKLTTKLILCALAGSLAFSQPLFAQETKTATTEQPSTEAKGKRKSYKGTIDSIDSTAKTVTVKKATTSKTFKIADDAKFATADKKDATLADLKQGDQVNIRFTEEGDTAIAHRIAHTATKETAEKSE